jgi:hypothetical protein
VMVFLGKLGGKELSDRGVVRPEDHEMWKCSDRGKKKIQDASA